MDMPKILVVDDEEDLCEILKFNLEIEGYEVDTAFSAEEALKMDIASYQLLLLDVMMGEISGFKMASKPCCAAHQTRRKCRKTNASNMKLSHSTRSA